MKSLRFIGMCTAIAMLVLSGCSAEKDVATEAKGHGIAEAKGIGEANEHGLNEFIQALGNSLVPLYSPGAEYSHISLLFKENATLFHCPQKGLSDEAALRTCLRDGPIGQLSAPFWERGTLLCRIAVKELIAGQLAQKSAICVSKTQVQIQSELGQDSRIVQLSIPPGMPFYGIDIFELDRPRDTAPLRFLFFSEADSRTIQISQVATQQTGTQPAPLEIGSSSAEESDCEDMRARLQEAKRRQQQAFGPDLPVAIQNEIAIAVRMDSMGCATSGPDIATSAGEAAVATADAEAVATADAEAAATAAGNAAAVADAAEAAADAAQAASDATSAAAAGGQAAAEVNITRVDYQGGNQTSARVLRSLDLQFRERADEDCPRGFLGKSCRQQIRESLCAGKWSSDPKPGETECRR